VQYLDLLAPLAVAVGIVLVITLVVYAGGARRSRRYRPGRPFEFTPVWFLSAPERLTERADRAELVATEQPAALPAGARPAGEPSEGPLLAAQPGQAGETGGASDRW
jgi:hypothetical protein